MKVSPLVSVSMITYNHQEFIREAIQGVLMQVTNFDFELIIADDCSPDDTQKIVNEIILNHPKGGIIKYFKHDKNLGMQPNGIFASKQCKGEYIAVCEGDDYWIDPLKLQKQVDFLEKNQEYSMIGTASQIKYNDLIEKSFNFESSKQIEIEELVSSWVFHTCTILIRKSCLVFPNWSSKYKNLDFVLTISLALKGKVYFLNEYTATYRKHNSGMSSTFTEKFLVINFLNIVYDFIYDSQFCLSEENKLKLQSGIYQFIKKIFKGVIIDELSLKELHFIIKNNIHESIKLYEFDSEKTEKIRKEAIENLSINQLIKMLAKKFLSKFL
jgi:glycosyltransferase involved in cell wall biosynthesis